MTNSNSSQDGCTKVLGILLCGIILFFCYKKDIVTILEKINKDSSPVPAKVSIPPKWHKGNETKPSTTSLPSPTYQPNTYLPPYIPSYSSTSEQPKTLTYREVPCSFCKGSGKDPYPTYAPYYGGERTASWCSICKDYKYPHYHKNCVSCGGTGYKRERVY